MLIAKLSGINIISYYLPYVLTNSVGLDGPIARLLSAVNALTYLGSTFIGLYFIDRWGRRPLMMYGALGQSCCWLVLAILLILANHAASFSSKKLHLTSAAVLFFFLFNCFYGAAWLGVSWLYATEINSNRYRLAGMSYGVAVNRLIRFITVFVTPLGIANLGPRFYIIWTILNAFMIPIIKLFYPETAGRSLEDIDTMFEKYPTVWAYKYKAMTSRKPVTSERNTDEEIWIALEEMPSFGAIDYGGSEKSPVSASREASVSPKTPTTPSHFTPPPLTLPGPRQRVSPSFKAESHRSSSNDEPRQVWTDDLARHSAAHPLDTVPSRRSNA